jgi:hypothetical protein
LQWKLGSLFGLFALGNWFAEAARMIAVESILNGLGDRACLKIFREHRAPRSVLQSRPMTTVYGRHGNEQYHMAQNV